MINKKILASLAIMGSISLSAYTYEVQALIGENFTEDNSIIDDSTAFGIRLNKYISEDNAIMFGYSRLIDADYKHGSIKTLSGNMNKSVRSCEPDPCEVDPCKPTPTACPPMNGCQNTGSESAPIDSGYDNNNDGSLGIDNQNNSSQQSDNLTNVDGLEETNLNKTPTQPSDNLQPIQPNGGLKEESKNNSSSNESTDIDRFYINGLHHIKTKYSRLSPYVYAGFGYERVDNENSGLKSQGFFDAGLGLKFALTNRVSLLADIQGIKKFRDNDLDILGSLGIGFFFGGSNIEPEVKVVTQQPVLKREITIVKVKPTDAKVTASIENNNEVTTNEEYYIQLAAAFKTDLENGCHYTEELKRDGIDSDIKYVTIKGKNASILVTGPYMSKQEAQEELYKIKKISKDAFIRTIK